jgi:leucyl-tRNA synthetase
MVLNHAYFHRNDKGGHDYVPPEQVEVLRDDSGRITGGRSKADGRALEYDGLGTMSKSKLNGVDPQDMIDRYGADAARMYVMFAAPPDQTMEWSDAGVEGQHRYLRKLWAFAMAHRDAVRAAGDVGASVDPALRDPRREIHQALAKINDDYERLKYNTVVSGAHIVLNTLESIDAGRAGAASVLGEGL